MDITTSDLVCESNELICIPKYGTGIVCVSEQMWITYVKDDGHLYTIESICVWYELVNYDDYVCDE